MVIAIIALLAAMLLPALARSKLKATEAVCLSNQHQLSLALLMYANENSDQIIWYAVADNNPDADGYWEVVYNGVEAPWAVTGLGSDQATALFTAAWKTNSGLFPFAPNPNIVHCPGDVRYLNNAPGKGWAYDSYSKCNNIAGDPSLAYWGQGMDGNPLAGSYFKLSQIPKSSQTFSFKEDVDSRGYNAGTWVTYWNMVPAFNHRESYTWCDPDPLYHGNISTMSFCDGHAEPHKWVDPALIAYGKTIAAGNQSFDPPPTTYSSDYEYIYQGLRFPAWAN